MRVLSRGALWIALLIAIAIFGLLRPAAFFSVENAGNILSTSAPLAVLAMGLTVPLIVKEFDLSFASVVGFAGAIAVTSMTIGNVPWPIAISLALFAAIGVGLLNGFLVVRVGTPSFIMTLALGTVVIGFEFLVTGQRTIYGLLPDAYSWLGRGSLWLIDIKVLLALLLLVALYVFLSHTQTGRYMYATGGNLEAAYLAGVPVGQLRRMAFVISALSAGIAGLLITAEAGATNPSAGVPFLLPAFSAAFLGAAAHPQGLFNVVGTAGGVILLGVIQTGIAMLSLAGAVVNIVQGGVLVGAIVLTRVTRKTD